MKKLSIWDRLSIILFAGAAIVFILFLVIYNNPYTFLNPFPPPFPPGGGVMPTSTSTVFKFPATWTPTIAYWELTETISSEEVHPSSTPILAGTLSAPTPGVSSSEIIFPTATHTKTMAPTVAKTPTVNK